MTAAAASDPRELAREILHERRFHGASLPQPLRKPLQRLGDALHPVGHALRSVFDSIDGLIPGGTWLTWLLLGAGLAIATAAVVRHQLRVTRGRAETRAVRGRDGGPSPVELERAADAAQRAGRYAEALRLRFGFGLATLAQRGVIEQRASLRTGEVSAALHSEGFDAIARAFDEVVYGGRAALEQDAEQARAGWRAVLARERG